jgi:hypothetical protein
MHGETGRDFPIATGTLVAATIFFWRLRRENPRGAFRENDQSTGLEVGAEREVGGEREIGAAGNEGTMEKT